MADAQQPFIVPSKRYRLFFDKTGNGDLHAAKKDPNQRYLSLTGFDLLYSGGLDGQPSVITCSKASMMTPLLFDPGDKWEYGSNIDWCAQIVEGIRGKRLGEVFKERVFAPLGMQDITFSMTPSMKNRLAVIHQRDEGSGSPC
jgi:methyl acetate hydrolase